MPETYIPLGTDRPFLSVVWLVALPILLVFALILAWKTNAPRRKILPLVLPIILLLGWSLAAYRLGFPTNWLLGPCMLGIGIMSLTVAAKAGPNRWIFAVNAIIFSLSGVMQLFNGMHGGPHVVLGDGKVFYRQTYDSGEIPREGLTVSDHNNWWTAQGRGQDKLRFDNSFVFWGPHGPVNGGKVGDRVASWAGTQTVHEL